MYTDPNLSNLFLQVFAATLVVLTAITFVFSRQAKTVRVRVRRTVRNEKYEKIEK